MILHQLTAGDAGTPVVLLHGLFGQGRNWNTVAKGLSDEHRVRMLDLPDHGRSPWSEGFDYLASADAVAATIGSEPATVVGHSMGGKVAMVLALRHPDLVRRLVVSDMSPVSYGGADGSGVRGGEIGAYARALNALDLADVTGRADADRRLADVVPDPGVRAFLLQNLRRGEGDRSWRWQANLPMLERDVELMAQWPEERLADVAPYPGSVLWVAGERSGYVRDDYAPAMSRWFPHHRRVVVKNAGHWVHSDQPEVFTEILRRFAAD